MVLLKNLNVELGLVNGTRLIYKSATQNRKQLIFKQLGPSNRHHFICRITMMIPLKTPGQIAYLRRCQFPIRLAYGTTVHKSQSQTFDRLGIFLPQNGNFFAEGMAYTALSRLRTMGGLRIFAQSQQNGVGRGKINEISLMDFCAANPSAQP